MQFLTQLAGFLLTHTKMPLALCLQGTLVVHDERAACWDSQSLLNGASPPAVNYQLVLLPGELLCQVQDLLFVLYEYHKVPVILCTSIWMATLLSAVLTFPSLTLCHFANFLRIHSVTSLGSLIWILNGTGSWKGPWGTHLPLG